jgi:urea transporter/murein DD-endopeptidase MepM/ murein hydrolase activator NlpD
MSKTGDIKLFIRGIPNSYSQVFFSDNRIFAIMLLVITFIDLFAGLMGLISVFTTNLAGFLLGFDRRTLSKGLYGFNSLLVGLALGVYFEPGLLLIFIVVLGAILTLLVSLSMQGVIGKYALPFLSIPFLLSVWIMTLATRDFTALGVSERGIYTFNDLYMIGGPLLVGIYDWWNALDIHPSIRTYLISLGAILFQYNILSGIILALGLLYYSRISFTLSLVGFYTAYVFYEIIGADISELSYSYIGFNYILTSIALGGFFIVPSIRSYFWVVVLIPLVALVTISLSRIFMVLGLPIYSLPFNIVVLLFLYALKFRIKPSEKLAEVFIQQNSPEKNLYAYHNDITRFRRFDKVPVKLPFLGMWTVSQAHDGEYTHKDEFRHAWDFVITDTEGKQFSGQGNYPSDYYCYDKPVTAPADGTVEHVVDNVEDNRISDVNVKDNWGNTVIIQHEDGLYSSMSHLKKDSIKVSAGERVKEGDIIGRCGNSGRSPYPHLHFQFQPTPYIGSTTMDYPLSYYVLNRGESFNLESFAHPRKEEMVSNIEINPLLQNAFHFIPGQKLNFRVNRNGHSGPVAWEVQTDPFNNTFIRCQQTRSVAWFQNDGNLLYFTHYEGNKTALLYYFFLAAYKVQQGFYQDMVMTDRYPLNLIFRFPLLTLQDVFAPFWKFLTSIYRLKYSWIDNEISPTEIKLESSASNVLMGKTLKRLEFIVHIRETGIWEIHVNGANLNLSARCTE